MTKEEVQQRVSRADGSVIDLDDFMWDESTQTFSSDECGLVLDFEDIHNCKFIIRSDCKLRAGSNCLIDSLYNCVLETGDRCTFDVGDDCEVKAGKNCVVVAKVYEEIKVIRPPEGKRIGIDGSPGLGYEVIDNPHMITIEGKEVEVDEELYRSLKDRLSKG